VNNSGGRPTKLEERKISFLPGRVTLFRICNASAPRREAHSEAV
jgi:hypothetical protein